MAVLLNAQEKQFQEKNLPIHLLIDLKEQEKKENDIFQRLSEVIMECFGEQQYVKHWLIKVFDNVNRPNHNVCLQ